jgi:RNA polymerase sigma-70 factor (ECF subfamily)
MFFTIYAKFGGVRLQPAWVEGREVIAVFEDGVGAEPSYFMWLEWQNGRISFIRDYRYARYIVNDAALMLAADSGPADDGR